MVFGINIIKDFMDLFNLLKIICVMKEEIYYSFREYILGNSLNVVDLDKYCLLKFIFVEIIFNINMDELFVILDIIML